MNAIAGDAGKGLGHLDSSEGSINLLRTPFQDILNDVPRIHRFDNFSHRSDPRQP